MRALDELPGALVCRAGLPLWSGARQLPRANRLGRPLRGPLAPVKPGEGLQLGEIELLPR